MNNMEIRTLENVRKFYFKGTESGIDYPSSLIGTKTPSIFIWTKMEHLYSIMSKGDSEKDQKIIVSGTQEYTAIEFMRIVSGIRMWTFDRSLIHE